MEDKKDLGSYDPEGTADAVSVPSTGSHTPGPWQIHSDYTLEGMTTVIANVDGEIIDGTTHYTFDFICDTLGDDDAPSAGAAKANARLITACPDLLKALQRYLAAVKSLSQIAEPLKVTFFEAPLSTEDAIPRWHELDAAGKEARAAIAKALGQ